MNYLEEDGIEHRQTTLLWPQANGEIKKQTVSWSTCVSRLCIAQAQGRHWKSEMDNL